MTTIDVSLEPGLAVVIPNAVQTDARGGDAAHKEAI